MKMMSNTNMMSTSGVTLMSVMRPGGGHWQPSLLLVSSVLGLHVGQDAVARVPAEASAVSTWRMSTL